MKRRLGLDTGEISYDVFNEHLEQAIIFIHGNSSSHRTFINQKDESLFSKFKLIFIDLPGHGESSKLDHYSLPFLSEILCNFISKLNLKKYVLVGHSLGGHIILHSLKYLAPEGIFFFGAPPIKENFDPYSFLANKNSYLLFSEHSPQSAVEEFMEDLGYLNLKKQAVEDYFSTDGQFRVQLLKSIETSHYFDEVTLLKHYQGKIGAIFSNEDSVINNKYIHQVFDDNQILVECWAVESGHCPHIELSEAFNSIVADFANEAFELNFFPAQKVSNEYEMVKFE